MGVAKAIDYSIKDSQREALRQARENQRSIARQLKEAEKLYRDAQRDSLREEAAREKRQEYRAKQQDKLLEAEIKRIEKEDLISQVGWVLEPTRLQSSNQRQFRSHHFAV